MALRTQTRSWRPATGVAAAAFLIGVVGGCAVPVPAPDGPGGAPTTATTTPDAASVPAPGTPSPTLSRAPTSPSSGPTATAPSASPSSGPPVSDGRPRTARLTIPALDIEDLVVRPHRGSPDDATGTRIQDRGIAASPYGPDGGVGPGGLGNHIITAHRLSSTQAFLDLPSLRGGALVHLDAGGRRYTYRIVRTRITSFRSPASLAAQSAPVPGEPGVRATQAMITLSTCRTPEDRAEGNNWSDEFGNPEHRIDKIGELVSVRAR